MIYRRGEHRIIITDHEKTGCPIASHITVVRFHVSFSFLPVGEALAKKTEQEAMQAIYEIAWDLEWARAASAGTPMEGGNRFYRNNSMVLAVKVNAGSFEAVPVCWPFGMGLGAVPRPPHIPPVPPCVNDEEAFKAGMAVVKKAVFESLWYEEIPDK